MAEPILELRDVKTYFPVYRGLFRQRAQDAVRAVDGVSLTLARGEVLGLVGDDHLGLQGEGARDGDPLALAAGKLVGVLARQPGGEPDQLHQLGDPPRNLPRRTHPVDPQGLGQRGEDVEPRVEGGVGVLEDHLQVPPAGEQVPRGGRAQVAAVEDHGAAGRRHQLQDRPGQGRLAAAGFTDQPQHLPAPERQADPVHRAHRVLRAPPKESPVDREMRLHVAQFEDGIGHGWA